MKLKLIMVGLMVVLALALFACSSPVSTGVYVEVPIDDFMNQKHVSGQVEVAAGESFTVTLGSNPTTGFQWAEEAQSSDTGVLKQVDHEFIGPKSEPLPPPGTPCQEVWTFEALEKGTTTMSLEYSRPWEGGEKGEWTFQLTVNVK